MFELSKKQVGAIVKVLDKNPTRPMLEYLRIDTMTDQPNLVAVATNGFVMMVFQTSLEAETHKELVGKGVQVNSFKKWYATAGSKDTFGEALLTELAKDINQSFDWQRAIPTEPAPIDLVAIDPVLMRSLQDVADKPLFYTTYGEGKPVVAKRDGNTYLLMPLFVSK